MLRIKQIIGSALLLGLTAQGVWADGGRTVGNGGDGVRVGRHIYLLDFLDAGIEQSPVISPSTRPDIVAAVSAKLDPARFPVNQIAGKIEELANSGHNDLAMTYLLTIQAYQWYFVGDLVDVRDEDNTLEVSRGQLVQLAIRRNGAIQINRRLWNQLTPAHQAGLVFHEINYALMPASRVYDPLPGYQECTAHSSTTECGHFLSERYVQDSAQSRIFVGFLFAHDLDSERLLWPAIPLTTLVDSYRVAPSPNQRGVQTIGTVRLHTTYRAVHPTLPAGRCMVQGGWDGHGYPLEEGNCPNAAGRDASVTGGIGETQIGSAIAQVCGATPPAGSNGNTYVLSRINATVYRFGVTVNEVTGAAVVTRSGNETLMRVGSSATVDRTHTCEEGIRAILEDAIRQDRD